MNQKRLIGLVLMVVLLVSLVGCAAPAAQAPGANEPNTTELPVATDVANAELPTIVVASNLDEVVSLDPANAYEYHNLVVHNSTYDTLVESRPEDYNKITPRLAKSWEISPDATSITFHLDPAAKFASGNPVTADDVVFSFLRLKNVKGNPSFYMDLLKEITAVDAETVKIDLTEPSIAFLSICTTPATSILDSKVAKEHGATDAVDADKTDTAKEWLDQNSAGSGPFILTKWEPKVEIVMVANPNYWRGAPKISQVIIKHIADPTTALQMLERGDVDIDFALDVDLIDQAKSNPNVSVLISPALNMNYLAMTSNPDLSKELTDKRVRQAIEYSIDFDGLMQAIFKGYATRAPSIIPIGITGVDPSLTRKRDVVKAKELLTEAGYPNGFEIKFSYASNPTREIVASKLKADLAEVGINLALNPMEESIYLSDLKAHKIAMGFGGWGPDYLDVTMWTDYFAIAGQGIAGRVQYDNPKATELARAIQTEVDPAKREQMTKDLQVILMDDDAIIMLYQAQAMQAFSSSIKGFVYHPVYTVNFVDLSK